MGEKSYNFEFVLMDRDMRKKLLDFIKPNPQFYSYQNLNLAYGVVEKKHGIFVTMTEYMSQAIMRDGRDCNDYVFAVFYLGAKFSVRYSEKSGKIIDLHVDNFPLPANDIIMQAIAFYNNYTEKWKFEDELEKNDPGFRLFAYKIRETEKFEKALKAGNWQTYLTDGDIYNPQS